jgi:hypothetical protein
MMGKRPIGILFLTLSSAAGLALAQGAPPTGVQKGGAITLLRSEGKVAFGGATPVESTTDIGSGAFQSIDYTQYTPPATPQFTTIGPCVVSIVTLPLPTAPTPAPTTRLDAGPVLNVNGPNGTKQLPQVQTAYFAMLGGGIALPIPVPGLPGATPLYLDPGAYTVDNGAGGADVGPFTVTLTVPSPGFVWTNADADLTIVRSAGVDIQWTGGDPNTNVAILGSVSLVDPASHQVTGGGAFSCSVPNNGEFVVTSDVLSLLPSSSAGSAAGNVSTLTVGNSSQTSFSATGIDTGYLTYSAGDSRTVQYQ